MPVALKLLLVEDDPAVRQLLCGALRDAGYDVTSVERFEEADREIDTGDYDLVITDVRLPGGSGANLAHKARALGRSAILVTGYDDVRQLLERTEVPHLTKPFRLAQLFAAINEMFPQATRTANDGGH